METFSQICATPVTQAGLRRMRTCGATFVAVALVCGFSLAQAESVSVGGVSAGASVGSGGISAGASVGGASGATAGASVGGTTGGISGGASVGGTSGVNAGASVGGVAGAGTTSPGLPGKKASPVQVGVGVGPIIGKTTKTKKAAAAKPLAILGPNSVVGLDTNVLGLDVVADAFKYNGNILDLCIGSCRDTAVSGGGGGSGGNGGGVYADGGGGKGDGGGGGVLVVDPGPGVILPNGTVATSVGLAAATIGVSSMGPCGESGGASAANASEVALTGAQSNGNPGPGFALSTADLNLPIKGVALRCSAGGNAQVYNGYTVLDISGKKIGIVHDTFLTSDLKIRRVQFQGLDQRCFGLSDGKYSVKGDALTVNVPASFVYQ